MICVQSRDGWCATKRKRVASGLDSQKTVCGYVVVMPWGYEERRPDCPACKKILKLEATVEALRGRRE